MKRRQHTAKRHQLVPSLLKVAGILVAASAVGLSIIGPERYSVLAAEVLPQLSLRADAKAASNARQVAHHEIEQRVHHFSMAVVGGRSTIPALAQYQRAEFELVASEEGPLMILRVQATGRNQPVNEYEKAVSEDYFSAVWQQLRDLEVAQLTDLSPYTENLEVSPSARSTYETASATYSFYFKDGVYDYPASFEVHAPEHLQDKRYQGLRDLTFLVLAESFGDVLRP